MIVISAIGSHFFRNNTWMLNQFLRLMNSIQARGVFATARLSASLLKRLILESPDSIKFAWIKFRSATTSVIVDTQVGQMYIDLHDQGIGRKLALSGIHEEVSSNQLKKELEPGMNVLEIGANIGYYVILAAKEIGSEGRILAFEPSSVNIAMLQKNIELSSLENIVHVEHSAVGETSGEAELFMMEKANTSSLIRRSDSGLTQIDSEMVRVVSIDDYLGEHEFDFDWFRMDVEGYEFEIVRGMKESIAKSNPKGCFIEVHSSLFPALGHTTSEFLELINSVGFNLNVARWRGRTDISVTSDQEWKNHALFEEGYWEAFFQNAKLN